MGRLAISPDWLGGQIGHLPGLAIRADWPSGRISHVGRLAIWADWPSGQIANLGRLAIWPDWSSGQVGHLAGLGIWVDWPSGRIGNLGQSGHLDRLAIWPDCPGRSLATPGCPQVALGERWYRETGNPNQPDERLCPILSLCLGLGPTGRQRRDKTRHFWDRRRCFCDSVEKSASPGRPRRDRLSGETVVFRRNSQHYRGSRGPWRRSAIILQRNGPSSPPLRSALPLSGIPPKTGSEGRVYARLGTGSCCRSGSGGGPESIDWPSGQIGHLAGLAMGRLAIWADWASGRIAHLGRLAIWPHWPSGQIG